LLLSLKEYKRYPALVSAYFGLDKNYYWDFCGFGLLVLNNSVELFVLKREGILLGFDVVCFGYTLAALFSILTELFFY
jgi:hypothetical protein